MNKKILVMSTFQEGAYGHLIVKALREMGHRVLGIDHRMLQAVNFGKQHKSDQMVKFYVNGFEPDILFTIKGRGISPRVIKDITAFKVNWWLDNANRFAEFEGLIEHYDKYYLCEDSQGHPWMSVGIDPDWHKPVYSDDPKYKSDIVFAGTAHVHRSPRILKILAGLPYEVAIWGNSWPPNTPYLRGEARYLNEDFMTIMTNSNFVLNNHYVPGITPNMRTIEGPASGTALLSDTGEGIEKTLNKGTEYIAYDTPKEARYLIYKYLEEPEEREKIAKAGLDRVNKDHLLKDKLVKMLCLNQ